MPTSKIMPTAYLLIFVVAMVILHFLLPIARIIPQPWHFLGIIPLAFGRACIAGEERMLADKFGAAWQAYKQSTRRWL